MSPVLSEKGISESQKVTAITLSVIFACLSPCSLGSALSFLKFPFMFSMSYISFCFGRASQTVLRKLRGHLHWYLMNQTTDSIVFWEPCSEWGLTGILLVPTTPMGSLIPYLLFNDSLCIVYVSESYVSTDEQYITKIANILKQKKKSHDFSTCLSLSSW